MSSSRPSSWNTPTLGAVSQANGSCRFRVWAPAARKVEVHLVSPRERLVPLQPTRRDYHEGVIEHVLPGSLYRYRLDGEKERPDPASRFQPQGVHGPSQVVDPRFDWQDRGWYGIPLADYVLYELHVGTFTPDGLFDDIIPHLGRLKELGITAVELMPVAQFPGGRNWGYDGVGLFAVQNTYGGPDGLKRLVNACHQAGLAVVLDVVYNHLGPEGNYLSDFGPYFTGRYKTPWGDALNFDGPDCDEVRHFFIENALVWQSEFHIDALRLDAIHAIHDTAAVPFLEDLATAAHRQAERLNRRFYLIAESNLNDVRVIRGQETGGYGLDAQWSDDFHHTLHTLLTGELAGYYMDFGKVDHLVRAYRDGFTYAGQYSEFRRRRHGNPSRQQPARQFVVSIQNHDQVGNRMKGDRLSELVSFDGLKLAAAAMLLSPYIPLLFMGEEYAETAPFLFFTSHGDPGLVEAVRKGRQEEFAEFRWQGEVPDPQDEATFQRSKLRPELRYQGNHRVLKRFYQELLRLRKTIPALALLSKDHLEITGWEKTRTVFVRRWAEGDEVFQVLHFGKESAERTLPLPAGQWHKLLDSADEQWGGNGSKLPRQVESTGEITLSPAPRSVGLYRRA